MTIQTMSDNIAKQLRTFVGKHPSIRECLNLGILNYSALARLALNTTDEKSLNAGVVAAKRMKVRGRASSYERSARQFLSKARVRVSHSVSALNIQKSTNIDFLSFKKAVFRYGGDFYFLEGQNHYTVITNSEFVPELKKQIASDCILKTTSQLALVALTFPPIIETTPGVVAYVYGILAVNGINLREEFSCWTDLIIVIDKSQLSKVMQIFEGIDL